MALDLTALDRYVDPTPPFLPGFSGKASASGKRGPCVFIYTVDHDGQVEISLALPGRRPPTDAHVRAFFRAIGAEPFCEYKSPRLRHFVVVRGTVH